MIPFATKIVVIRHLRKLGRLLRRTRIRWFRSTIMNDAGSSCAVEQRCVITGLYRHAEQRRGRLYGVLMWYSTWHDGPLPGRRLVKGGASFYSVAVKHKGAEEQFKEWRRSLP